MIEPMSNLDFDNIFTDDKNYLGCYYMAEAPQLDENQYAVLNTDKVGGPGKHWVGLYRPPSGIDGQIVYYFFNSFGTPPPAMLEEHLKEHKKDISILYNDSPIQHNNSVACGYFTAAWLQHVISGKPYYSFIDRFNEYKKLELNDVKVIKMVDS